MNIVTTIGIDFAKKHAFTRTSPAICGFPLQPVLLAEGRNFPMGKQPRRVHPHASRAAGLSGNNPVLGREIPLPGGPVSLGLGMGLVRLFFQSAGRVSGA